MSDFMYQVVYGSTPAGKCHFITHFLVVVCSLPWNSKRSIICSNVSGRILSCGLPVMLRFNGCLSSLLSNFCGIFLPYLKLLPHTVWYTASAANGSCAYSILDLTVSNQLSVRVSHISLILTAVKFCGIFLPYLKLLPHTVWYTASAANGSCAYSSLDLTVSDQLSVQVSHISLIVT